MPSQRERLKWCWSCNLDGPGHVLTVGQGSGNCIGLWACTGKGNGEVKRWKNTAYLCEYSIGIKRVFEIDVVALDKDNTSILRHCMIPLQSVSGASITR
ncbi:hypothetical protein N7449_001825 [Penicillium cf. viridicatum]|uniref:Uncharacterized protein n=1 Tax=Penicillium cf. viridicatum TaxID=2972119 RepID=A0A9W9T9T4_9EURO|nr:hypothetical protein N7449_001825 [Penicillium cf. viridicatum]